MAPQGYLPESESSTSSPRKIPWILPSKVNLLFILRIQMTGYCHCNRFLVNKTFADRLYLELLQRSADGPLQVDAADYGINYSTHSYIKCPNSESSILSIMM